MHRNFYVQGKGFSASRSGRKAGAYFRARRRGRSDGRLWRQPRQNHSRPHGGFERVLHHELSRPGGEGAERYHWDRARFYDYGSFIYQRPARSEERRVGKEVENEGGVGSCKMRKKCVVV